MKAPIILLAAMAGVFTQVSGYDNPQMVDNASLGNQPFCSTGLIVTEVGSGLFVGSGSLVGRRTVLTASHISYDFDNLTWYTGQEFALAFNQSITNVFYHSVPTAGMMKLAAYSQATADGNEVLAFNADVLTLYSLSDLGTQTVDYSIQYYNTPCLAAEEWRSILVGYPSNDFALAIANPGRMFVTGPNNWAFGDYLSIAESDTVNDNLGTAHDSYGTARSLYVGVDELAVYRGNSGGPLLGLDPDLGTYTQTALVVGSNNESSPVTALFRAINSAAYQLIQSATTAGGGSEKLPASSPLVSVETGKPVLSWMDTATGETGWQIRRNDGNGWNIIATTAANATGYTDPGSLAGIGSSYSIRAVTSRNHGPWSIVTPANAIGHSDALADALSAPYLYVTASGNAPFRVSDDGASAVSGRLLNRQVSNLSFSVEGPCVLKFKWSVSCEAPVSGAFCDKLSLFIDNVENASIGGIVSDQSKSVTISAQGRHTVRFTYDKDNYQARNADSGSVRGISVFQTSGTETIPGNLDAGNNWRHSEWMGTYYNYPSSHWIFSLDLGFVYVNPITQSDWESRHDVWMYLNDPAFGWTWTDITNWPWCWSYTKGRMYYLSDGWFWVDNTQRFEQLGTGAVAYR